MSELLVPLAELGRKDIFKLEELLLSSNETKVLLQPEPNEWRNVMKKKNSFF